MSDPISMDFDDAVAAGLARLDGLKAVQAVMRRDGTLLSGLPIDDQVGWVVHLQRVRENIDKLTVLARVTERQGYDRVLVIGGHSAWPDVIGQHLRGKRGVKVRCAGADYATNAAIAWARQGRALFVVVEADDRLDNNDWQATAANYARYRAAFDQGADFVAVGPHGGNAEKLAAAEDFREFFTEYAQLSGPFAATGLSGLIPAVLAGAVLTRALTRLEESLEQAAETEAERNPAAQLAAFLWAAERLGRWQLLLCISKDAAMFGDWISQLLTAAAPAGANPLLTMRGYDGATVDGEATHGQTAVAVGLSTFEQPDAPGLSALEDAGVPSHAVVMPDCEDLWAEAMRWQMAVTLLAILRAHGVDSGTTAAAGATKTRTTPTNALKSELAVPSIKALAGALRAELTAGTAEDVLLVVAYVAPTEANGHRLGALRTRLQSRTAARVDVAMGQRDWAAIMAQDGSLRGHVVVLTDAQAMVNDQATHDKSTATITAAAIFLKRLEASGYGFTHARIEG